MTEHTFPTAGSVPLRKSALIAIFLILFFLTPAFALEVILAWDKNKESDLASYNIYYKQGSPGPPYNGKGALQGDSPIEVPIESLDNPRAPRFAISGLSEDDVWYFVVTACNEQGLESDYSNFVSTDSRISTIPVWLLLNED